jgi:hypothetical protein
MTDIERLALDLVRHLDAVGTRWNHIERGQKIRVPVELLLDLRAAIRAEKTKTL